MIKAKKHHTNGPIDPEKLKGYVARVEAVEKEIADQRDARADIYVEVKSAGMKPRMVRKLVKERAKKAEDEAELAELERYRAALAMPGATYRSAAAKVGIPASTLHRKLSHSRENGTDAIDPATGEITTAEPPGESDIEDATPRGCVDGDHTSVVPPSGTSQPAPEGGVGTGTHSAIGRSPLLDGDAGHRGTLSPSAGQPVNSLAPLGSVSPGIDAGKGGQSGTYSDDLTLPPRLAAARREIDARRQKAATA